MGGQAHPFLQVPRPPAYYQRGGGVHQDDVPLRPVAAAEDVPDDLSVLGPVAALEVADRRPRHPEVLRAHPEAPHHALADLGDLALPRVRDLVQAVGAVDDEGTNGAQLRQDASQRLSEGG